MGNFCACDVGINGFAACKRKKNHPKGIMSYHFCLRTQEGLRAKMKTHEARGMIFLLLECCKAIYAQVTCAEIAFIFSFSGIYISGKINGILDWLGRNFFADQSFMPSWVEILLLNQCTLYFVFQEILIPEMVTR